MMTEYLKKSRLLPYNSFSVHYLLSSYVWTVYKLCTWESVVHLQESVGLYTLHTQIIPPLSLPRNQHLKVFSVLLSHCFDCLRNYSKWETLSFRNIEKSHGEKSNEYIQCSNIGICFRPKTALGHCRGANPLVRPHIEWRLLGWLSDCLGGVNS
jgi:hypothetical protein